MFERYIERVVQDITIVIEQDEGGWRTAADGSFAGIDAHWHPEKVFDITEALWTSENKNDAKRMAIEFYAARYYAGTRLATIRDYALRRCLLSAMVLCGRTRVTRWLQELLQCETDGVLGPVTADEANRSFFTPDYTRLQLVVRWQDRLMRVGAENASKQKYLRGWANRTRRHCHTAI